MKRKFLITVTLVCIFAAAYAMLSGIAGNWKGTLTAPDGNDYPLNYTFKTDSGKLTGTGVSPQGNEALTQGTLKGDSLFFHIDVNGVDVLNSGKYYAAGDSIALTIDYQGMKMHATLTRAADK